MARVVWFHNADHPDGQPLSIQGERLCSRIELIFCVSAGLVWNCDCENGRGVLGQFDWR